jgi:hypothetical protein
MTKYRALLFLLIVGVCITACVSQQKITYYEFPSDIAEEAKIANAKMLEKGKVLYDLNCAKCHNKKEKGKILLPDFTTEQLDSYIIRIKNETHVNSLPETKVTAEELEAIQFFFSYKKPSRAILELK